MQKEQMVRPGQLILAAVSGGIDSMVMAELLYRLRDELGFELAVANFNHKLRPQAVDEAALVRDWAEARGIHCLLGEVKDGLLDPHKNLQDSARRERYAFLRSAAYRMGASQIATAHHRDDQAETVLLHLLRGSGLTGLVGVRPANDGLIRPLLPLSRQEITDFAAANSVAYLEDESNSTTKYLRNRVRHELLPYLRAYNPQISASLADTAAICREDDLLLDEMAEISLAELWSVDSYSLQGDGFDELAPALKRRVLRKAFCLLAGEKPELSFAQTEAIISLRDEQSCHLPRAFRALRRGDIYFSPEPLPLPFCDDVFPLLTDGAWHYLAPLELRYCACVQQNSSRRADQFALTEQQAASAYWRTRRDGDFIPSAGRRGKKKVKELFIDAHIPIYQRTLWPLLVAEEQIVWIPQLWAGNQTEQENIVLIKIDSYDKI